jgi:uncharacterized repeat protein (TIGR03803 family)
MKTQSTSAAHNRRVNNSRLTNWRRLTSPLVLVVLLATAVIAALSVQAQTFTVLHSFTGKSGGASPDGLIRDSAGNLYGTTTTGGDLSCDPFYPGCGVVFKLDKYDKYTVLHGFAGAPKDGAKPIALVRNAHGNLYGTTDAGGVYGNGTIFKLDARDKEAVLYSFCSLTNCADGQQPLAGLVRDSAGNLYGTTWAGGAFGMGTVFKVAASGTETVLHSFSGADGQSPVASLIRDSAGNLYGTTEKGGTSGKGTVFTLSPLGKETLLYSFSGGADGGFPYSGLLLDAAGNLYGTTFGGGKFACGRTLCGTVFKLDTTGHETVLHNFSGGADGEGPMAAVVRGTAGNLYGTTLLGGSSNYGTVYKLDANGTETVLWTFDGKTDGGNPSTGVVRDSAGNLYGATDIGGSSGWGTVFKLTP